MTTDFVRLQQLQARRIRLAFEAGFSGARVAAGLPVDQGDVERAWHLFLEGQRSRLLRERHPELDS